jgi:hypothetical protein
VQAEGERGGSSVHLVYLLAAALARDYDCSRCGDAEGGQRKQRVVRCQA